MSELWLECPKFYLACLLQLPRDLWILFHLTESHFRFLSISPCVCSRWKGSSASSFSLGLGEFKFMWGHLAMLTLSQPQTNAPEQYFSFFSGGSIVFLSVLNTSAGTIDSVFPLDKSSHPKYGALSKQEWQAPCRFGNADSLGLLFWKAGFYSTCSGFKGEREGLGTEHRQGRHVRRELTCGPSVSQTRPFQKNPWEEEIELLDTMLFNI